MKRENNNVYLNGVLSTFQYHIGKDGRPAGWASVITLHPKQGEGFEMLTHRVRLISDSRSESPFAVIQKGFSEARSSGVLYPCSLNGYLTSYNGDSFIVSDIKSFSPEEKARQENNNIVNLTGRVESVSVLESYSLVKVLADSGVITSFVPHSDGSEVWKSVTSGNFKKGSLVSMKGALISEKFTDGKKTLNMCLVAPKEIEKLSLGKKTTKKNIHIL